MKRPERLKMCNEAGLKNYQHLKKSELAKLLEIELPKKLSRKEEKKCRKSHRIEIFNSEYSSINKAAKSLGVYPMQIYAKGNGRFLE